MEKSKLNMLINLFGKSRDIVWITDEKWEIQWGRDDYSQIRNLPEILKIPADSWDMVEKQIYWDGYFYQCTVYGSKTNKCRIVILKPVEQDFGIPEEVAVDNAVQSLMQVKDELQEYMHMHEPDARPELLKSIERNCYLIHHKSFIKRILKSIRERRARQELFSVQMVMREIQMEVQKELGIYADVKLKLEGEEIFLKENKKFFEAVILAGIILSHHNAGYFHSIELLVCGAGSKGEVNILLSADIQQEINMTNQIDSYNFGALTEEKKLLDTFCSIHGGKWKMDEPEENRYQCRIDFRTDSEQQEIEMHQPERVISGDADDIYRIMLSRVYLSDF